MGSILITDTGRRIQLWCRVFILNLLLPSFLSLTWIKEQAWVGMLGGILTCWIFGTGICWYSRVLGTSLFWGGLVVGLSQMFFWLHFVVGDWALRTWRELLSLPDQDFFSLDTALGGFSVTVLTGGILMILSILLGMLVMALCRIAYQPKQNTTKKA
jgi:hypothetical protein